MIQRIQSVFLGIVILIMIAFCFSPIWVKVNDTTADKIVLTPTKLTYYNASVNDFKQLSNISVAESNVIHLVIIACIVSLISLVSLVSYKNRIRQMKLGFINILLLLITIALIYFQIVEADKILVHPVFGNYQIGFFLPIVALFATIAANYYIKKDEDLVRSADRLR